MQTRVLWMVGLLMMAAGCTQAPEAAVAPMAAPVEQDVGVEAAAQGAFGWAAGSGGGQGVDVQLMTSSNALTLEVPDGAGGLSGAASWTCSTPTCTLHFYLYAPGTWPGGAAAAHGAGTNTMNLSVDAPEPGEWLLVAFSDTPVMDVQGEMQMRAS